MNHSKGHLRDYEGNQTDFDKVGNTALAVRREDSLDERDDGNKDKDTDEHVADLLPNALEESDLLLLGKLVKAILLKTSLGFSGRQTLATNVFRQAKLGDGFFLGHDVVSRASLGGGVNFRFFVLGGHG